MVCFAFNRLQIRPLKPERLVERLDNGLYTRNCQPAGLKQLLVVQYV